MEKVATAARQVLDGCTVQPFGSAITGLWLERSDLDLCVVVPGVKERDQQTRALRKLAGALRRLGATHHVLPRIGAQMPIIRWQPRRPGLIACDISVNNTLAVANSKLVAQYVNADSRVRPLALAVKMWAAARGINQRSEGTLSSFALILMVIHFLQQRSPPVLPSLQDIAVKKGYPPVFLQGVDVRFSTRPSDVEEELKKLRQGAEPNSETLQSLLEGFFHYYALEYRHGTIALRSRKNFEPRADEATCYLVVDNPFEPGKDVANVDIANYSRLRDEFLRAHKLVLSGADLATLLEAPPKRSSLSGGSSAASAASVDPMAAAFRPFGFSSPAGSAATQNSE